MTGTSTSNTHHQKRLTPGTRVTVYWSDDDAWYNGTVTCHRTNGRVLIQHQADGHVEEMDPTTTKYYPFNENGSIHALAEQARREKRDKVEQLQVGGRLSLWWPHEKEWYTGTLTHTRPGSRMPHYIEYDDGDEEWTNLVRRKFQPITATRNVKVEQQQQQQQTESTTTAVPEEVGSAASIIVTGGASKQECLVYPDKIGSTPKKLLPPPPSLADTPPPTVEQRSRKQVLLERLRKRRREFMEEEEEAEPTMSNSSNNNNNNKKRARLSCNEPTLKLEEEARQYDDQKDRHVRYKAVDHPEEETRQNKDPQQTRSGIEKGTSNKRAAQLQAFSRIDYSDIFQGSTHHRVKYRRDCNDENQKLVNHKCSMCRSIATRPRAAACHHIFCKSCIRNFRKSCGLMCPFCKNPKLSRSLIQVDPDHDSYRPVQALEMTTAEVKHSFSSASEASRSFPGLNPSRVINSCRTKAREDKECHGYYWRFKGCTARVLRLGESATQGQSVEQVDPTTGEIIRVFPSLTKAYTETGAQRGAIRRICDREGKAIDITTGSFWRYQGETHGPWPDPKPHYYNPLEQLDLETGKVVATYDSLADAKKALGLPSNRSSIGGVCNGRHNQAHGYFWRWKGSNAQPDCAFANEKVLQISKTRHGKVLREFRNSAQALEFFGHPCCNSTLSQKCRNEEFYLGYYWRYKVIREKMDPNEKFVKRRVAIKQDSGKWLSATITSCDRETGRYEFHYDYGKIVSCKFAELGEVVWKKENRQKPVEKVDMKTGEVLATFPSARVAANYNLVLAAGITAVCRGNPRSRSMDGFFWRYEGSNALPRKDKCKRQVEQLCLKTGRVLETFESVAGAARAVDISAGGIGLCCHGKRGGRSAAGYGWRFVAVDHSK